MRHPKENEFINIHSHRKPLSEDEWVLRNAFHFPINFEQCNYSVSVGIHPWFACLGLDEVFETSKLKENTNILAIGEIGLDRRCKVPFERQLNVFEKQLSIAQKLQMPVIIHCVKAYSDLVPFMKKFKLQWILHGFNVQSKVLIEQLLNFDCYFSLGIEVFKTNYSEILPLYRILIETDTKSVHSSQIYEQVALQYNVTLQELKLALFTNFKQIFIK